MDHEELEGVRRDVAGIIADVSGALAWQEACEIVKASLSPEAGDCALLALVSARAEGAPLGLLIGLQSFLGVQLLTGPDVLIARAETELLGREVIALLRAQEEENPGRELRLIDMGCGSGNICCAAAGALPRLKVWASDLTSPCAELTRANVARLGFQGRVEVYQGDLFEPLRGCGLESAVDVVAMNPPYIASTSLERQRAELLRHEPREAFDGGPYGISIQTRLIREAPAFLRPGGYLLFEFGKGQAGQVSALVKRSKLYQCMDLVSDAEGEPRVGMLKR